MNGKIITEIINAAGIRDVGFCEYAAVADRLLTCRAAARLPKGAKSIILFLMPYRVKASPPENICRYAAVPDYHAVAKKYFDAILPQLAVRFPENRFEAFTDNSPIPEVYAAARAGLGVYGENGLLINRKYGSYCFICEIVTNLEIPCENAFKKCPACGNCKSACPRGDLGGKCLSAVSQQKKEPDFKEKELLRRFNTVWGCDVCAEVCPLNRDTEVTYISDFLKGYKNSYRYGEDIKGRAYEWRGEAVVKRNYKIICGEDF